MRLLNHEALEKGFFHREDAKSAKNTYFLFDA
jgi:hypothetical protein